MEETIFDKIVAGTMDAYIVWQDSKHVAFLTPYPNTPGFTVLIPKSNHGDYIFELNEPEYSDMMQACKTLAKILEKAFGSPRVALVYEGTGVKYVHAKLIPLHGDLAGKTNVWSDHKDYADTYRGWLTTAEGPEMDGSKLKDIQNKIIAAGKSA